jgi:predicted TIM-barrel fold metal-dependent hydrolase
VKNELPVKSCRFRQIAPDGRVPHLLDRGIDGERASPNPPSLVCAAAGTVSTSRHSTSTRERAIMVISSELFPVVRVYRFIMTSVGRLACCALALVPASTLFAQDAPVADHHQHLFSPALAALISPPPPAAPFAPINAGDLVKLLDDAGIKRAVVLSTAYIFTQSTRKVENEADKVRVDNDWTASQVAQFPDRLIGFCGLHPLKDWALEELARCAKNPQLRNGLKLHFGNSEVDYHNAQHVERLARVFRAANGYRMPIVVHMRASFSQKLRYGAAEARIFLNELVPAAPDIPIQIAHLAGGAPYGVDPAQDPALAVFVEAIAKGDPRVRRLFFDVSGIATAKMATEYAALAVRRIRELGLSRILYGSDGATPGNSPREAWTAFRTLPLTDEEFRTIAGNVPPYLK